MEPDALTRLKRVVGRQTTTLTHYGRKTGKPHEVTIWFVLDHDKFLCLAKTLSVPKINSLHNFLIAKFAMTMVHVQLRPAELGTGGPLLSFAPQTTSRESGASPTTRCTEA